MLNLSISNAGVDTTVVRPIKLLTEMIPSQNMKLNERQTKWGVGGKMKGFLSYHPLMPLYKY